MEFNFNPQFIVLILMPFISGAIGWFTNFVAVKMLLRPIHPVNVLGLKIQGLLPRRHQELAKRISKAIAKDFLTEENIIDFVKKVDSQAAMKKYIVEKWDEKIGDILSIIPMIQMFLPADKLAEIRDKIADSFSQNAGEFAAKLADGLAGNLDLQATIEKNILAFDLEQLESIIEEIAKREFRNIEQLGGVIGFLIGAVQAALVFFFFT